MHPLISVDELATTVEEVGVYDLRWDLSDPKQGRTAYERGHIPGAVFVDLDRDLAGQPGVHGRHPLPDPERFATTLGSLGITPETHVVVYDDSGGRVAARMWWMLRSIGHTGAQLLDGGYQAWLASGRDVGVGTVMPRPAEYPAPAGFGGVVGHADLVGRPLIDARAEPRYRGEIEPVDPKPGHIPGAVNIPTDHNLGLDGRFLEANDLAAIYADIPKGAVVSCGSGVTACHDALAMVLAGRGMPDVYVGSYSEWTRLGLPVNTGIRP